MDDRQDDRLQALVDAGASFDWITPAIAIVRHLRGSHVGFVVSIESWDWVEPALRDGKVRVCGVLRDRERVRFSIPKAQLRQAERVLDRGRP